MYMLQIDSLTDKFPTRIVAESVKTPRDERTYPTATIMVEIDDLEHPVDVVLQFSSTSTPQQIHELLNEWEQATSSHEKVKRNVTLVALPSERVIGTGTLAIVSIGLRPDDVEDGFYVTAI